MNHLNSSRPIVLWGLALVAIIFGALTIKSAYLVLFTTGTFHQEAGNYLPAIVWFNGIAGIFYLIAGLGLWKQRRWSLWLAATIALATLIVFALFGLHVNDGGLYEQRTVGAMTVRSGVWVIIALAAWFKLKNIAHTG